MLSASRSSSLLLTPLHPHSLRHDVNQEYLEIVSDGLAVWSCNGRHATDWKTTEMTHKTWMAEDKQTKKDGLVWIHGLIYIPKEL